MLGVGQNRPTQETQPYESRLSTFKVNELQTLLQAFKVQKIGKKNELYTRCVELLRTPTMTRTVIEKIREIEARVNQRAQPYPLPTNHSYQQQQQQNMYRTNGLNYNAYGGGMAGLNQLGGISMHQTINTNQLMLASSIYSSLDQLANLQSNITPRPARNLTAMPLPFYDPIHTLLEPQELPASCNPGQPKMNAQVMCQFSLSTEHHMKLSIRENEFPRTEVQLRFFNTTGDILNIEQPDDFPLNCNVRINDVTVTLPSVIPTNKPNVEPKRPSRPVNITPCVINQPREKTHRMRIDWTADKRQWAVAIYLVTRVNADILRQRIVQSPSFELPYETTEATIRKRLGGGDDDDVSMDSLKISLLCPLMKTRMGIAARSRDCTHLQCFDLDSYLMLNEKKPAWKCGVCNSLAPYHKLIIDKYFMKMLKDLGQAVTDVELLKDGSYRVVKEDFCDLSDDDIEDPKPKSVAASSSAGSSRPSSTAAGGGAPAPPAAALKRAAADDDIITLSDDDDGDMDLRKAIQASMPTTAMDPRTPVKKVHASPSSDDSIIVLDDTPPRPEPVRVSAPSSSAAPISTSWRNSTSSMGGASTSAATSTSTSSAATTSPAYPPRLNLSDTLSQAGFRTGLPPSHLQLNGAGPHSAAGGLAAGQQPSAYDWGQQQQQPQSAPPTLQQQQQQNWGYPQYSGFYTGIFDPRAQAAYGTWVPPNGPPVYPQNCNGAGVIRRQDADPRDPR